MSLPLELQKLPPQALDVIRFLATQPQGAYVDTILDRTGLSERSFGKAIRRLVTRYYVEMPAQGFYTLTANGRQAAQDISSYDGSAPTAPEPVPGSPQQASLRQERRLTALIPKELVAHGTSVLMVGFDAPGAGQPAMTQPGRVIFRVSAPGCDVLPTERPLEVTGGKAAGPLRFRIEPRREGQVRIKIEAFQLVTLKDLRPLGGMYFDIRVAGFPTPESAELQALGAPIRLYVGG